jgi:hypothetical protein
MVRNMISFYGKELLAPRPNPKLEDHLLSAVRDCLFNIFAATLHTGGRSFIRNLRTRHAVVTLTHLSRMENLTASICKLIYFNFLCNISFKEHLHEDGQNKWPKHVAGYAVYNIMN